jgi:hypothetical protein
MPRKIVARVLFVFKIRIWSLLDGEIWTAHEGVNPCSLVVRWGEV